MDRDETMPDGPWRFDAEVTQVFANMLARSIPGYNAMRALVTSVGQCFASGAMLDLGCSHGETIASFLRTGSFERYVGIDASEPMVDYARSRFKGYEAVDIRHVDITEWLPHEDFRLVTMVLTMQFVPLADRLELLQAISDRLATGGGLIIVEKVVGSTLRMRSLLEDLYDAHKLANGYSTEAIDRKKASLVGVMEPVSVLENETIFALAGYESEMFFRHLSFAGWILRP